MIPTIRICVVASLSVLPVTLTATDADFPDNENADTISLAAHATWAPEHGSKNYWKWYTDQSQAPSPVLLKKGTAHLVEAHVNCSTWTVEVYVAEELKKTGTGEAILTLNEDTVTSNLVIRVHVVDDDPGDEVDPPSDLSVTLTVAEVQNLTSSDSTEYDNPDDSDSPFEYVDAWPMDSDPETEDQEDTWSVTLNPSLTAAEVPSGFVNWPPDDANSTFSDGDDSLQQVHTLANPATYTITVD